MKKILLACLVVAACTNEQNVGNAITATGSLRWAISFGTIEDDVPSGVAIDSLGDVVVVGELGDPYVPADGLAMLRGFVSKRVASDGSERWRSLMTPQPVGGYVDVNGVAIAPDDSIVVIGAYNSGAIDFGGQTLAAPATTDTFVAKYGTDGTLVWVHSLDPTGACNSGQAIAIAADGTIYIAGNFRLGTLALGSASYTADASDIDGFIAAFEPSGALLWSHALGENTPLTHIATTPDGDVIGAGTFSDATSLGGAIVQPNATYRAFYTRYRDDGLYLSSQAIGATAEATDLAGLGVDADDRVVVETAEGSAQVASTGIYAFDPDDTLAWSTAVPNDEPDSPPLRALAITPDNVVTTTAWTYQPSEMEVASFDDSGHTGRPTLFGTQTPSSSVVETIASVAGSTGTLAITGEIGGPVNFGTGTLAPPNVDEDVFVLLLNPP